MLTADVVAEVYSELNAVLALGNNVSPLSPIAPESPMGGGLWTFQGLPPVASIINYGQVRANKSLSSDVKTPRTNHFAGKVI